MRARRGRWIAAAGLVAGVRGAGLPHAVADETKQLKAAQPDDSYRPPISMEGYAPLRHLKGTPEIVFGVTTGHQMHQERAKSMLDTWCSDVNACVFFSDWPNPYNDPATVEVNLYKYGFTDFEDLDVYKRAQLRFLPALSMMRTYILENHNGHFGSVKWLVMCDDDTYVFYYNLAQVLNGLDHNKAIYTGNAADPHWFPVHSDGSGKDLGVGTNTRFVNGGGGSIFSIQALKQMTNMNTCLHNSLPGQAWDKWQSDWMIGQCVADAGLGRPGQAEGNQAMHWDPITELPQGTFNQFACTYNGGALDAHVHYCGWTDGEFTQPATIHPVKTKKGVMILRNEFPKSATKAARNVALTMEKGDLRVMTAEERDAFRQAQEAEHRERHNSTGVRP